MFPPSPDNGKLYSLSTQGHSHKVPLKQLYVLSAISSILCKKKGGRAGVLYLTPVWGDGRGGRRGRGGTKDKEKHQRNTGGTGSDEEMWMVRARREGSDGGGMKGEK